jgi:threonine dehydrogenase-like Zn-dependent dehydrogenase
MVPSLPSVISVVQALTGRQQELGMPALAAGRGKRLRPQQRAAGRAGQITAPRVAQLVEDELPVPAPQQVRIRVEGCGVCGSNVPVWEGRPWFTYPLPAGAPGHEGWGIVDEVGSEVTEWSTGERVAFLSERAFAEFDVADQQSVVRIPESLAEQPVPAEPLACAMNVFRRSGIAAGQRIAVVGSGFVGALLIQLAAFEGAEVIAVSRRDAALETAQQMGAKHVLRMDDPRAVDFAVKSLTDGDGCDCVIEATGFQQPLTLAAELVRVRGRLVIAGYHQDGLREVNMQSWNWRGIDVINAHERDPAIYIEGMQLAIEAIRNGRLNPSPLYTHTFPLSELGASLEMTCRRPAGFMKALVMCD